MKHRLRLGAVLGVWLWGGMALAGSLENDFVSPPQSVRPWATFYTPNGYLSPAHLPQDVEAMSRSGLGGFLHMQYISPVKTPLVDNILSKPWMDAYGVLLREAHARGMGVGSSLSEGNGTGGHWITEPYAAKKLVWTETQVDGPASASLVLPAVGPEMSVWTSWWTMYAKPTLYRDVAVVAFREADHAPLRPDFIQASSANEGYCHERDWPEEDTADADPNTYWRSGQMEKAKQADGREWVQHSYREPLSACGALVVGGPEGGPWPCRLEASEDEKTFKPLAAFTLNKGERKRVEFAGTTAKHFRLVMIPPQGGEARLAELCLLRQGDVANLRAGTKWWMFKSANRGFWDYPKQGPAALEEEYPADGFAADLKSGEVIDLTDKMAADGKLAWTVPPGRWTILRFGYNTEGMVSRSWVPSLKRKVKEMPYEADVLNPRVAEYSFNTCAKPIIDLARRETGKPPAYFHIDSWELGASCAGQEPTWTDEFRRQFQAKRGYDLLRYLPVLARRVVDSRETSNRFLWDYRRTIADLIADFYGRLQELCEANGTQMCAQSAYGTYPFPHMDGLMSGGRVGLPKGEFWCIQGNYHNNHVCDYMRNAASAGRVYGHRLLSAESLTGLGTHTKAPLDSFMGESYGYKTFTDTAMVNGLNDFCLFFFQHQWSDAPLQTEDPWTILDRHSTWLEQSHAWFTCIARCQSLLRRGWPVVDAAYFTAEGSCGFVKGRDFIRPALAAGYEYDGINAEVLLTRAKVRDGRIELPGDPKGTWENGTGMSYALLVFPDDLRAMSPGLLAKVKELIEAGATVLCPKPVCAQGLGELTGNDRRTRELAEAMWGTEAAAGGERQLGKGRLAWGQTPEQVLKAGNVPEDVELRELAKGAKVRWCHRRDGQADMYFLVNSSPVEQAFTGVFRVADRQPELFDPVSGAIRPLPQFTKAGRRTAVPLKLAPWQSYFVVFQKQGTGDRGQGTGDRGQGTGKNFPALRPVAEIGGSWSVTFDPKWGGPGQVTFAKLEDWINRPEEGIRYYSGTAVYRKSFDAAGVATDRPMVLDVGKVKSMAQVTLNGRDLGVIWCYPMRLAVPAGLLKASGNELEIRVVNTWANRMYGDGQVAPAKRVLKRDGTLGSKNIKLQPSGLLGPVRVMAEE